MCSELSSPEHSLSDVSSVAGTGACDGFGANESVMADLLENWPEMGEGFWSEVFPAAGWSGSSDFTSGNSELNMEGGFWRDVFNRAEELTEFI